MECSEHYLSHPTNMKGHVKVLWESFVFHVYAAQDSRDVINFTGIINNIINK